MAVVLDLLLKDKQTSDMTYKGQISRILDHTPVP